MSSSCNSPNGRSRAHAGTWHSGHLGTRRPIARTTSALYFSARANSLSIVEKSSIPFPFSISSQYATSLIFLGFKSRSISSKICRGSAPMSLAAFWEKVRPQTMCLLLSGAGNESAKLANESRTMPSDTIIVPAIFKTSAFTLKDSPMRNHAKIKVTTNLKLLVASTSAG